MTLPELFLLLLLCSASSPLQCHVNVGNEKYIPNRYDTETCPSGSIFCYTKQTTAQDSNGNTAITRTFDCDNGRNCRYGRGCYRESYSLLVCCCPNDDCNDGLKASYGLSEWISFVIVLLWIQ